MTVLRSYLARPLSLSLILAIGACGESPAPDAVSPEGTPEATAGSTVAELVPFETFELDNGLDVILHVDESDPVVAINLAAHVGSAREVEGRTGFAHLFEHLLFLDSENLGYGGLDSMNTRIGGEGTNGFTTNDMTQYFQAVPADALEKVIWAEADKIGYFIGTVNQNVIDREKQVVKNEKRQRVDNQPYGHALSIIAETMYPDDHPYSWTVIGSLEDLEAATVADARAFFERWYVPNNVTVSITGDFDPAEARRLVERYFGEIPAGDPVPTSEPRPASLSDTVSLYYEDNFANAPRLYMVWPGVREYHPDSYALNVLLDYLTEGKEAPLRSVLVDEDEVSPSLFAFNYAKEMAGELFIAVDALAGDDIDGLMPSIARGFERFEDEGIPEDALARIKINAEVAIYDNLESALGKAIQLSEYNVFTGDPGYLNKEIEALRAVTAEDVRRVYETYLKDQHLIYLSVVPKGEAEAKLDDYYPAQLADIDEEVVVQGAEADVPYDPDARIFTPTPSAFDRTVEPAFGAGYTLPSPDVVRASYSNGLEVFLIETDETPVVRFSLALDAGRVRNGDNPAVAGLAAALLEKGTASRTTAELEDAIRDLGSEIDVSARDRGVVVTGKTLSRNFAPTMDLVKEMLFEPRFDADEFATLKRQNAEAITQAEGEPNSIARREAARLQYPEGSPLRASGLTGYGSRADVEAVTLDDVRAFHAANYSLAGARLRVVGDVGAGAVQEAWDDDVLPQGTPREPVRVDLVPVTEPTIYFYDVPGAKQSVIRAFTPSVAATNPNYGILQAINFPLGGIYTSDLMTELRVNRGYTYGIRSGFNGEADGGTFAVSTSVRTNVTKESLELIRDILKRYGPEFTQQELAELKDARLRGEALKTESLSDKLRLLSDVSDYGFAPSYRRDNAQALQQLDLEGFQALAGERIDPDSLAYLVVGDAQTQLERVRELGLPVVELN